jgi:hypothetical protein
VRVSIASPLILPSPFDRRVGIRIVTFEACSGFTHVTARRIAQPPKAAFVTRLQPCRLPGRTARQLPDQSTTLWAESSSASNPRLRGARSKADINPPMIDVRYSLDSGPASTPRRPLPAVADRVAITGIAVISSGTGMIAKVLHLTAAAMSPRRLPLIVQTQPRSGCP